VTRSETLRRLGAWRAEIEIRRAFQASGHGVGEAAIACIIRVRFTMLTGGPFEPNLLPGRGRDSFRAAVT
jgi:hypothetical protein